MYTDGWDDYPSHTFDDEPHACDRVGCNGTATDGHGPYCSAECVRVCVENADWYTGPTYREED